jgi:glucose/arabinose dehydrogenase
LLHYFINASFPMKKIAICLFFFTSICAFVVAQIPRLELVPAFSGFSSPVDFVNAGDGSNKMYVVEQSTGRVRIINSSGTTLTRPFINLRDSILTGGERGLLSLAFHPNYAINRTFFVWYTSAPDGAVTLARFQTSSVDADSADKTTGVVLFKVSKPNGYTNHNGAKINFGPDGYLYVGTGDGGSGNDPLNLAQNGNSLLGKMLRIDVNNTSGVLPYGIPPNNPYLALGDNIRDEIIALGLRNPWRWCFDKQNGDLWIADVGQDALEEVNYLPSDSISLGTNWGWRCYEGNAQSQVFNATTCINTYNYPAFEYEHNATGGFSITGGEVYRGTEYPLLNGWYVCTDYVLSNIWAIKRNSPGNYTVSRQTGVTNISGFGWGENGKLYALRLSSGQVFEVQANTSLPVKLQQFTVAWRNNEAALNWMVATESNMLGYDIEMSEDGIAFTKIGFVAARNTNGAQYNFNYAISTTGNKFFRLKQIEKDGKASYSPVVALKSEGRIKPVLNSLVQNGILTLQANTQIDTWQILSMDGRVLKQGKTGNANGVFQIDISNFARAMYIVRLLGKDLNVVDKITVQ